MARTSKTVIGGDSKEQSALMMQAAESGQNAQARGHEGLMRQYQSDADQANENAALANQVIGQGLEREQQAQQFNRGLEQRQSETELEAAKAGFEPNTPGQQGQEPQGQKSTREQKLEEEMRQGQGQPKIGPLDAESQQRLSKQAEQPLEMDSQSRWRPTKAAAEAGKREATRKDFQADTDRIQAMAYREQVAASAQKALRSGDTEAYEQNAQILANVPNDQQKRYDRMMTDKSSSVDWDDLSKAATGIGEMDSSLEADIKSKKFTPRVAAFARAQIGKGAMEAIVGSMGDISKLKVDWTNPVMQQFQGMVKSESEFMRANPAIGSFAAIKSTEDKMRFLNVMAAAKVIMGMGRAPMGQAAPNQPPSMGPNGQPQQGGGQQPMVPPGGTQVPGRAEGAAAARGVRTAGGTPQQALQAGQQANPTADFGAARPSREPYRGGP